VHRCPFRGKIVHRRSSEACNTPLALSSTFLMKSSSLLPPCSFGNQRML
jgi:hypothetical protein